MQREKQFDVIIIGGSYSGLATGMALGRALRNVLIIDSGNPANRQTPYSHNFLTNDGKAPGEIASIAKEQVKAYKTVSFLDAFAVDGGKIDTGYEIKTETGETFQAGKLVFATGIRDIMPDLDGFAQSWGKTVLHCPYCHGYEVKYEKTGILANGESGFELSSLISNWTDDLTLFTNGKSTLDLEQIEKLNKHKIKIDDRNIERIEHVDGYIENIVFTEGGKMPVKALYAKVPFSQHSTIAQKLGCETTPDGYIKIDAGNRTTVPGIYACGDNSSRLRTVANAVSMGTTTGLMVNKDLIAEQF